MPNDKSPIDLFKSQSQNYQPFLKTFQQSEDIKKDELFGLLTSTFPASKIVGTEHLLIIYPDDR